MGYADLTAESIADAMTCLDNIPPSRARSMVATKLDEAMMWLDRARPAGNGQATALVAGYPEPTHEELRAFRALIKRARTPDTEDDGA